jgi:GT2 family glycosyltransferase
MNENLPFPDEPLVSVVVPVRNGEDVLGACLGALRASRYKKIELIVVDDGSTDRSAEIAGELADRVIRLGTCHGAAAARNRGAAAAQGEILLFNDADVLAEPDTVQKVVSGFQQRPEVAATFGLYRRTTIYSNFFSVFKNLIHHYTHLTSSENAWTFWSGCGAIRRDVFRKMGGFDESYRAIEDIELGYRLQQAGERIHLDKDLSVTHMKRYSLRDLVYSDFVNRAVPWTKLILERKVIRSDLNVTVSSAASLAVAYLMAFCLLGGLLAPAPAWLAAFGGLLAAFLYLNRRFYRYVWRAEGPRFTLGAMLMHYIYYLYGGTGLAAGGLAYLGSRHRT